MNTTEAKNYTETKILTPIQAIRAKCLDCCCGQRNEVKLCPCTDCSLYPYRMGKRPKNPASAAENGDIDEGEGTDTPRH